METSSSSRNPSVTGEADDGQHKVSLSRLIWVVPRELPLVPMWTGVFIYGGKDAK